MKSKRIEAIVTAQRRFMFLQGPHGPFFSDLAQGLRRAGHRAWRISLNSGDDRFWRDKSNAISFGDELVAWPRFVETCFDIYRITDVVLYSDTRPVHRWAKRLAKPRGIRVHCFEEGYLRPYWVTYERDGANGNSELAGLTMEEIRCRIARPHAEARRPPAQWGETWHHSWYSFLYHSSVLAGRRKYPAFDSHRAESIPKEAALHLARMLMLGPHAIQRGRATARLMRDAAPYHVVLMQLDHDANMRDHSDFAGIEDFVRRVVSGFRSGARPHHQLVFKAHPFEDGRKPISEIVSRAARDAGISERVRFLHGGRLGPLLDRATSAVTVNSTAAQQALWRGLPVKALGRSVYNKEGLVSSQELPAFFANPTPPDAEAYQVFRQFLLETSQFPGGFYSRKGRHILCRVLVDRMLEDRDIYRPDFATNATSSAILRVV